MSDEKEYLRDNFLLEWYNTLWNNARGSMEGIWKLIAPLTLIGTIWFAIYKKYLPADLGNSLVFIILYWAMNITIDFNQWHRRNLFFMTTVEREFFRAQDYGKLIPASFKTPKKRWISFYVICFIVFSVTWALALLYCLLSVGERVCGIVSFGGIICQFDIWIVLSGGMLTAWNFWRNEKSSREYFKELFEEIPVTDCEKH